MSPPLQAANAIVRSRVRPSFLSIGVFILVLLPLRASAYHAVTLDSGFGLDDTRLLRFNYAFSDKPRQSAGSGWFLRHFWEANLSYWYLYKKKEGVDDLYELGLTPTVRAGRSQAWSWGRPYLEGGIGVHLLSKVHIRSRDLSSSFQFGTHVGLGIRFGQAEQWDLAWRFEHISNGGLVQPNPGINFSMVRFGYHW